MDELIWLGVAFGFGFLASLLFGEGLLVPWLARLIGRDDAEGPKSGAAA